MGDERAVWQDVVWVGAAAVFAGLTVRYTWDIARLVVEARTWGEAAPLVVVGVVIVAAGVWLTLRSWRRTRWGGPRGG
jgi:Zn-dependent protease